MSPSQTPSARNGLHLIESLTKQVPWESPNEADCCQGNWLLSTLMRKPVAVDNNYTFLEHGGVKAGPTWSLYPSVLVSLV